MGSAPMLAISRQCAFSRLPLHCLLRFSLPLCLSYRLLDFPLHLPRLCNEHQGLLGQRESCSSLRGTRGHEAAQSPP